MTGTRTVPAAETSFLVREHGSTATRAVTPALLLHGVPETASLWDDLGGRLGADRQVLAPDLPGLGGSVYTGPFDIPSLVRQLAALVEQELPGQRVDVVGHDWGGSLALALAGSRPDLVRRLVVANAPYRQVPLIRAFHIPFFALPLAPELLFRLGGRRVVRAMLSYGWRDRDGSLPADRLREYEAAYSDPDRVAAMLSYYRCATRPRLLRSLQRRPGAAGAPATPRTPITAERTMVIWGTEDPVLPLSTGERVVRDLGPDCVMVTIPGAGHFVIEEAPKLVADAVVELLDGPGG